MTFNMTVEKVKIDYFFTFKNSCHTVGSICIAGGVILGGSDLLVRTIHIKTFLPSLIDDKHSEIN